MDFRYYGKTEQGKKRLKNEDEADVIVVKDTMFMIIADGFGIEDDSDGIPCGNMIVREIKDYINKFYINTDINSVKTVLEGAFYVGNKIVNTYKKNDEEKYLNYGCSLTICGVLPDLTLVFYHAGITRLYLLRQGEMFLGTRDDNKAQELLENGSISKEEYENHELRGVLTNGLGFSDDIKPTSNIIKIEKDDILTLLTDGIYRLLGDERVKNLIIESGNIYTACDWLIEGANLEGGIDNISVLISYFS